PVNGYKYRLVSENFWQKNRKFYLEILNNKHIKILLPDSSNQIQYSLHLVGHETSQQSNDKDRSLPQSVGFDLEKKADSLIFTMNFNVNEIMEYYIDVKNQKAIYLRTVPGNISLLFYPLRMAQTYVKA